MSLLTGPQGTEGVSDAAIHWPTAAYIHIPFCRRRCFYCDFPISVVGDGPVGDVRQRGETSPAIAAYVDLLCEEIAIAPQGPYPLETIFFGGGTPSLLSRPQVSQVLAALEARFEIAASPEISMEMDPGTFSREYLQGLKSDGINRVSLGAQSFTDALLQACGRSHSVAQIYTAVDLLAQVGITNVSLDLISGLPNQSLSQWQESLEAAIALHPQHLSTYDLVLEPTTVFGKRYQPGISPLPLQETAAQMYQLAAAILPEAGYHHYEISNYAQPGYACRHNQIYWKNAAYYGFGMGATSYLHRQRFSRPRTRTEYRQWVETLQQSQGQILCEISSSTDILLETIMLGFRLAEGISLRYLAQLHDPKTLSQFLSCISPYQDLGWVELYNQAEEPFVRLTDPDGFLFSNQVLAALWERLDP
ncbi:MAG: coproporphyrinogen III oxidase [Acaryochloridaceae cyanobacterium SU_2_1]|nr:coproporphyrinogen III oxidase [Acaryochloridaceae cyanobacterium SU_2_1]